MSCGLFTAVFNPTGAAHSTLIGPCGASLFTIELWPANLRHLDIRLPPPPRSIAAPETCLARPSPVLRFKTPTADSVVVGAQCSRDAGSHCRIESPEQTAPRWFGRVKDHLHEGFRKSLRMRDLARIFRKIEKRGISAAPAN
jgi:hypothetical protein